MDNKELDKLLSEHKSILQEISNLQVDIKTVNTKRHELEKDVERLRNANSQDQSRRKFAQLADDFVSGILDEEGYEKEKTFLITAGDELEEKVRLLEATTRVVNKISTKIVSASGKETAVRCAVWTCCRKSADQEIRDLVKDKIAQAWAVASNVNASSYDNFLRSLFPQPPMEEHIVTCDALRKKIFGDA